MTRNHLGELRPYVAIDFCDLAVSICRYDGLPFVLDRPLIDRVANICFVKSPESEERPDQYEEHQMTAPEPSGPDVQDVARDPYDDVASVDRRFAPASH